jgi:ABC-2 type transport system ATP-binding protein
MGEYSGGMQRRADLASALIHLPPVLFLDEPTEGLDPHGRTTIWETLERLNQTLGMTILLTTHYMEEADRLCDRLAIVDHGRIVVEGTPSELKAAAGSATLEDAYLHSTSKTLEVAA